MKKSLEIFAVIILCFVIILSFVLLPLFLIKLTYKTTYLDIIENNLNSLENKNENLNKSFILSVIKAESQFDSNAKSNKDAFGLMQLTFLTAKEVAKKLEMEIVVEDLFNPEINIKLGINYFDYLFSQNSDKVLVLMSYNAGLNRVKSWVENNEIKLENGFYVCPYRETTNYVKKVINFEKIYNKLVGI